MATGTRKDPYANFNFVVEIDGVTAAGFQEVSGLAAEVNIIEYREGADTSSIRKLPGLRKFTNVTLKRGVTQDKSLWNWFKQTLSGAPARATVAITLLDEQRNAVSRWTLLNAWPAKWEGPPLNAKSNDIAIETLEIAHEGLDWPD
jgi:phage tail-like protein